MRGKSRDTAASSVVSLGRAGTLSGATCGQRAHQSQVDGGMAKGADVVSLRRSVLLHCWFSSPVSQRGVWTVYLGGRRSVGSFDHVLALP